MDYLTEYNPDWPAWFRQIETYLRPQIPACLRLEHVGSTSIVGMAAKPIIDIDAVIAEGAMALAIVALECAGYAHQGDLGFPGREAFQPIQEAARDLPPHHLYACTAGALELRKHVSFRDYLSAHPAEAARLAQYKRHLAFERRLSRSEYVEAKASIVAEIAATALAWHAARTGSLC